MKRLQWSLPVLLFALAIGGFAEAQTISKSTPKPAVEATKGVLPKDFSGWQVDGAVESSNDPVVADSTNAAILKEYGFKGFEAATYKRDDGRTLKVRAARFADATGAYGAFTFYKQPEMQNEKIGAQASSLNNRVLFYNGAILIDAVFDHLTAMSAAELRDLAATLPLPSGGASNLPSLPTYLPKIGYVKNTAKYVVGAQALDKIGSPIPSQLVDFGAGAEVVLGTYNTDGGPGTLLLISYPTPQIAVQHLKAIDEARTASVEQKPGALPFQPVRTFADRRSGPLVAIAAGPYSESEAKDFLNLINYDANVNWTENTYLDKKNNIANLVWNVAILVFILIGLALIAGLAFGGVRILLKRLGRKGIGEVEEIEFISLGLEESESGRPRTAAPQLEGPPSGR
jgi:hypothetical protein